MIIVCDTNEDRVIRLHGNTMVYWVKCKACKNEDELWERFAQVLNVPFAMTHNFDALADVMCDLSWLGQREVCVVLQDFMHPFSDVDKGRSAQWARVLIAVQEQIDELIEIDESVQLLRRLHIVFCMDRQHSGAKRFRRDLEEIAADQRVPLIWLPH